MSEGVVVAKKLKRIDVVYKETKGLWIAVQGGRVVDMAIKKSDLLESVAKTAKKSDGTSVRVHKRDGQIQEERTYPRSADLRSSKG